MVQVLLGSGRPRCTRLSVIIINYKTINHYICLLLFITGFISQRITVQSQTGKIVFHVILLPFL